MTDEVQLPPGDIAPASAEPAPVPAEDPNDAASAAEPSSTAETTSAPTVSADAGASQPAASSAEPAPAPAEPQTFEQRVEARFLALEQALLNLPHAIAQANGHPEPASWSSRVHNFLFGKNEEPQA